ncbi:hypothetical protein ASAC_0754 [Acidilobus saccharovorans 345-15]|uniref:PEGA domain-containing protein n=1 Tax=Acidilobus saccharovorans (strain DSM 16705 / JCM 18335 / VKM B-2471 / 345-15) TaxID=666510 RepID=D9Q1H2_ACIS3|nr:PEGA domain-containing protein [Acidilobus saccharovorans]ADL19160.1 hypothetical protein ASAC_0754 [Acidilobus saccharovorans 345-15]
MWTAALLILFIAAALGPYAASTSAKASATLPVLLNGSSVGLCYPYLIAQGGVLDLATGSFTDPWPGDVALGASCGDGFIAVLGYQGTYFLYSSNASLAWVVREPYSDIIGVYSGMVVYNLSNEAYVEGPRGTAAVIPLPQGSRVLSFSYANGPLLLEDVNGTLELQSPQGALPLNVSGSGGQPTGILNGTRAYVFGYVDGQGPMLLIFDVSASPLRAVPVGEFVASFVPLAVYRAQGDELVVQGPPGLELVTACCGRTRAQVIGDALPVPDGYYVPSSGYSYVMSGGSWIPVPGLEVASLGGVAFITDYNGVTLLAPAVPTTLVAEAPVYGTLNISGLLVQLNLTPGAYELPTPSLLLVGNRLLDLLGGTLAYPAKVGGPVRAVYVVRPPAVSPLEVFRQVTYMASGGGSLLLVVPSKAIVLSPGVNVTVSPRPLVIPGEWLYGGLGPGGIALYSANGTVYVFSYSGSPVAAYRANITFVPTYMGVYRAYGGYYVMVESSGPFGAYMYVYGPGGASEYRLQSPVVEDPSSGVAVTPAGVQAPGLNISLPAVVSTASVNGASAAFQGADGNLYIVNLSSMTEYVVMPAWGGYLRYAPMPGGLLAIYNKSSFTVEIVSYEGLVQGAWQVNISASPPSAVIYINGTRVGVGSATVYDIATPINVTVSAAGYAAYSSTVLPLTSEDIKVSLRPVTVYATLSVVSPIPVSYVEGYINGSSFRLPVNSSLQLLSGIPYEVEVNYFYPLNVCAPVSETVIMKSNGTIEVSCSLTTPVLKLVSSLPASVKVSKSGVTVFSGQLEPEAPLYLPVAPGSYDVLSTANGLSASIKVNATLPQLYSYNVTPTAPPAPPRGTIEAVSNVSSASVYVRFPNGTLVAVGVGRVEVSVSPGQYVVSAEGTGYVGVNRTVTVSPGSTVNVTLGLVPVRRGAPVVRNVKYYIIAGALAATAIAAYMGYSYYRSRSPYQEQQEI